MMYAGGRQIKVSDKVFKDFQAMNISDHYDSSNGGVYLPEHDYDTEYKTGKSQMKAEAAVFQPQNNAIQYLNADSVPDKSWPIIARSPVVPNSGNQANTTMKPIGSGHGSDSPSSSRSASPLLQDGPAFTTDGDINFGQSRFLAVAMIPREWAANGTLMKMLTQAGVTDGILSHKLDGMHEATATMYCFFDDLRDAEKARDTFTLIMSTCEPRAINGHAYFEHDLDHPMAQSISGYDGQIEFIATYDGCARDNDIYFMFQVIELQARRYGEVRTFVLKKRINDYQVAFRAEYFCLSGAENALKLMGEEKKINDQYSLHAREYLPTNYRRYAHPAAKEGFHARRHEAEPEPGIQLSSTHRTAWNGNTVLAPNMTARISNKPSPPSVVATTTGFRGSPPSAPKAERGYTSHHWPDPVEEVTRQMYAQAHPPQQSNCAPQQSTYSPQQSNYRMDAMSPYRPQGHLAGAAFRKHGRRADTSSQPQCVDIEKIENGQDVRTTLMVRNVPNRFNSERFKEMLDGTSRGHFDFSYLRTDFTNNCNVGYAFVNFIRPELIIPFFHARVGKTWTGHKSEKVLEVSYATIQGQDCLIQKFRNSSVMQEFAGFRPKLWYSIDDFDGSDDTSVGEEREFPGPDNPSKLARSLDNAQAVGLYPPRGLRGNNNRDNRRRRGQWDRGTTRAIREEAGLSPFAPRYPGHAMDPAFGQRMISNNSYAYAGPSNGMQYGGGYPYAGGYYAPGAYAYNM